MRAELTLRQIEAQGRAYRLDAIEGRLGIPEVSWVCEGERVTLRDVVGAAERYEPARTMTSEAIASAGSGESTTTLEAELRRLLESPIILNRGLREAVLAITATGVTLSDLAACCGRTKRTKKGEVSGETSWLQRRLGIMPDVGKKAPGVWVHSEVLGLVCRSLGLEPRDVEVDVIEDCEIEDHWCGTCQENVITGTDRVCPWCENTIEDGGRNA